MALKDLGSRIRSWFGGKQEAGSRRPDGGTSCYRPMQRRDTQEENIAREKAAEYAAGQQPVAYAHTGFTGMNPPVSGSAPAVQSTLGGEAWGYGQPQQAQMPQQGYGTDPGTAQPMPGNISYMPGAYAPDAGSSFTHVEHILAITSLRSCYEAIECMKNGETLIVTLDVLGSEGERIRCQDMLAGAAFTLGCSVRTLQSAGVVIIVPQGVKILPEQRPVRTWTAPVVRQEPESSMPRRERRSSQNPVGWENAAGGTEWGYNPYTGTVPAAAGDYGMYGGY